MPMRTGQGFTLMELLITLGVVLVLAALLTPVFGGVRDRADRSAASSQMRQIALALMHWTTDQNGRLPGPMQSGQGPQYNPDKPEQLATALGSYLGVTDLAEKTVLNVFVPPAFARAMRGRDLAGTHPFVMNISASFNGQGFKPWGSTASPEADPMVISAVPNSIWAFCDADQKNPAVIGQPWANKTPPDIIHGSQRLAVYFDGSVRTIASDSLNDSGGGDGSPPKPPPPPPPPN